VRVDQYAFVPAQGGILAVEGALPSLEDEWRVELLAATLPPTRFLWTAPVGRAAPGHALRLRVFEPVAAAGVPPEQVAVPESLRAAFDRCVAELHGMPLPDRRAAWSRPGFHEAAEAWAGMPLEQFRLWPISVVLRGGDAFFKAVFPLFHHEPAVTEALGAPRLLRVDHDRGWMLMEALAGAQDDHHAAMRAIAHVHRTWATRTDEALALGAPDRRDGTEVALPPTLIHGDFHAGNVIGGTIIDWSDAAVANPLHDVNHYLLFREADERSPLLETYAEAWPGVDVHAAAAACEAETFEYVASSHAAITDALAPDDRWWFEDEEPRWLRFAAEVRAGKRPDPER
jgi:hypothetical protein